MQSRRGGGEGSPAAWAGRRGWRGRARHSSAESSSSLTPAPGFPFLGPDFPRHGSRTACPSPVASQPRPSVAPTNERLRKPSPGPAPPQPARGKRRGLVPAPRGHSGPAANAPGGPHGGGGGGAGGGACGGGAGGQARGPAFRWRRPHP